MMLFSSVIYCSMLIVCSCLGVQGSFSGNLLFLCGRSHSKALRREFINFNFV